MPNSATTTQNAQGELSSLEAHGVVLRHAARCERTVERVTGLQRRLNGG